MERGVYFDGWPHHNHCYHPSLPMRSMQMVEDLERFHGTLLVWSAMGGGSISLPYLEHEAFGPVDPRQRFYGHMNDAEFIAECNKRGIKVFGIVFEVQGWEFPVRISEDGRQMLDFNVIKSGPGNGSGVGSCGSEHDGKGVDDWYGLREFSNGKHDKLFAKKFSDYFPEGLYNSDGEAVIDLWTECSAKDYNGVPVHADWVEVVEHQQICYQMCRNNPVWQTYLKKITEIMIDAGCAGIQLDECELPITAFRYGGCFCKDCTRQFRDYLKKEKAAGRLNGEIAQVDLETFDYGKYLSENNIPFPSNLQNVPFFELYYRFQMQAVKRQFLDLAAHVKNYGRSKERDVAISGNFFNLMPVYYPLEVGADVIITEMRQTLFRQPAWYRYAAGFAGDKPIIIAENPYGGVVHELAAQLEDGKAFDLYRLFLLEASVYGCNMSVPYGGWMGNTVKTGFYPPRSVTKQVQDFIYEKERLFSKDSGSNICVLYSFPSYAWREAIIGYSGDVDELKNAGAGGVLSYSAGDEDDPLLPRLPFAEVTQLLSEKQLSYDVKLLADDDLRVDDFSSAVISRYDIVVAPDCINLTRNQLTALSEYVNAGGRLVIYGSLAENLPEEAEPLFRHENVQLVENGQDRRSSIAGFADKFFARNKDLQQISTDCPDLGVQTHRLEGGNLAIHLLNYRYQEESDKIEDIGAVNISVKYLALQGEYDSIRISTLDGREIPVSVRKQEAELLIKLENLPVYAVAEIIVK